MYSGTGPQAGYQPTFPSGGQGVQVGGTYHSPTMPDFQPIPSSLRNDYDHSVRPSVGLDETREVFEFKNSNFRLRFIRKVYTLLSVLLIVTALGVLATHLHPPIRKFFRANRWVVIVASVASILFMYAITCFRSLARKVPLNYFLLFGFGACQSLVVAHVASFYNSETVLIAAGLTAAVVLTITIFACVTKTDLGFLWPFVTVFAVVFAIVSLVGIFVRGKVMTLVVAGMSTLLFSVYLLLHTQLIVGKNERGYDMDDYVIATLEIYTDIVQLFLSILRIVGALKD